MEVKRLQEIKELLGKITQGEWIALSDRIQQKQTSDNGELIAVVVDPDMTFHDSEFISQCPTIVRELIAEVERLEKIKDMDDLIMDSMKAKLKEIGFDIRLLNLNESRIK